MCHAQPTGPQSSSLVARARACTLSGLFHAPLLPEVGTHINTHIGTACDPFHAPCWYPRPPATTHTSPPCAHTQLRHAIHTTACDTPTTMSRQCPPHSHTSEGISGTVAGQLREALRGCTHTAEPGPAAHERPPLSCPPLPLGCLQLTPLPAPPSLLRPGAVGAGACRHMCPPCGRS